MFHVNHDKNNELNKIQCIWCQSQCKSNSFLYVQLFTQKYIFSFHYVDKLKTKIKEYKSASTTKTKKKIKKAIKQNQIIKTNKQICNHKTTLWNIEPLAQSARLNTYVQG